MPSFAPNVMRAAKGKSLQDAAAACKTAANGLIEATKDAVTLQDECIRLAKLSKRLLPLLDDLGDNNVPTPQAEQAGVKALEDMYSALQRSLSMAKRCAALGRIVTAFTSLDVGSEFTNSCIDLHQALSTLDLSSLGGVARELTEDLALFLQQLQRSSAVFFPDGEVLMMKLREEAEVIRLNNSAGKLATSFSSPELLAYLAGSTHGQLMQDAEFLTEMVCRHAQTRQHVQCNYFSLLLGSVQQALQGNLPGSRISQTAATTGGGGAKQQAGAHHGEEAGSEEQREFDLDVIFEELISPKTGSQHKAELLALLQALLAASASATPVDEQVASQGHNILAILEAGAEPGQRLKQLLGLLNPYSNSTNTTNQTPIAATTASAASVINRLKPSDSNDSTDSDDGVRQQVINFLQCLCQHYKERFCKLLTQEILMMLLRMVDSSNPLQPWIVKQQVLILMRDAAQGAPAVINDLVQAKAINALVQMVATVKVVRVTSRTVFKPGDPATGLSSPRSLSPTRAMPSRSPARSTLAGHMPDYTPQSGLLPNQLTPLETLQLSALALLLELSASHPTEVHAAGALTAIVQILDSPCAAQLKKAALEVMNLLLQYDYIMAISAGEDGALVPLVDVATTDNEASAAAAEVLMGMLQPPSAAEGLHKTTVILPGNSTPASPARVNQKVGNGHLTPMSSPSQWGKGGANNTNMNTTGRMRDTCPCAAATMEKPWIAQFAEALNTQSIQALMRLIQRKGSPLLVEAALNLLPHTAYCRDCRLAINSDEFGMKELWMHACGEDELLRAAALQALERVVEEKDIKPQMAHHVSFFLQRLGESPEACARIALAVGCVLEHTQEKDKSAGKAACDFVTNLEAASAVLPLLQLVRTPGHGIKAAGAKVTRWLVTFGSDKFRQQVVQGVEGLIVELTECIRSSPGESSCALDSCKALKGLSSDKATWSQILSPLTAFMKANDSTGCVSATAAVLDITGESQAMLQLLATLDVMPSILSMLTPVHPAYPNTEARASASRLLALVVRASNSSAAPAQEATALQNITSESTVTALINVFKDGPAGASVAAVATLGVLLKRSQLVRDQLYYHQGATDMVDVVRRCTDQPLWDDAVAALTAFGALHERARPELIRALKSHISRGTDKDCSSVAAVIARLAGNAKLREALVGEGVLPALVAMLSTGSPATRAAVADALTNIAVPNELKMEVVKAGAVAPLVAMLKPGEDACIFEASEALYSLAAHELCRQTIKSMRGVEALQEVVQQSKRKLVGPKASKAAYDALMRLL